MTDEKRMKPKTPAPRKTPLLNKMARKVGGMAGSIVHAGNALATAAATMVETGREVKQSSVRRVSAAAPVVRRKRKLARASALKKKRNSQSAR